MKVTEITVRAGRTFNHPFEDYSNLRPEVELKATLDSGENSIEATRALQREAETIVEDHKREMLADIRALRRVEMANNELAQLVRQRDMASERIAELAAEHPQLPIDDAH